MIAADSSLMRVLRCFRTNDTVGFTELAEKLGFDTDLTGYYLRKLQRRDLVQKIERGVYQITPLGKSMLAHGAQLSGLGLIPRISVMLVASHQDRYLVVERQRQPFIGKTEWPTGPLDMGLDLSAAAADMAEQRLGLAGVQPQLRGFFRRIDRHADAAFDDKLFAVHRLTLSSDQAQQLPAENEVDRLHLLTELAIRGLQNPAKSLLDILAFSQGSQPYAEYEYDLAASDFYE